MISSWIARIKLLFYLKINQGKKMKELKTKITIQATPDKIWRILQDLKFYATWNPFIIYATGQVSKGRKFSFILKAPGEKPKFYRSIFKEIKENKELRWLKRALLPGLYNVEHIFKLSPQESGETLFEYHQQFSGLVSGFYFNRFEYSYLAGMKKMNQALKEICEEEKGKSWV